MIVNQAFVIGGGDTAAWPIQGLIRHFRPEIERRIVERRGGDMAPMQEAAE